MIKGRVNIHMCLGLCIIIVMLLCLFHVAGNRVLALGLLCAYLVYIVWSCAHKIVGPILLFFLPWSQLMRASPNSFSFYTFGLVIVCILCVFLNRGNLKRYSLVSVAKLMNGYSISFAFLLFFLMFFLFPTVSEERTQQQYSFFDLIVFFSLGICMAAISSVILSGYNNINVFVRVDSYATIIRRCGFYGDPNFYVAQITAALAGCMLCVLKQREKRQIVLLFVLIVILLYCGFLSGSKSFVFISLCLFVLWCIQLCRLRGRLGLKLVLSIAIVFIGVYIATSALFAPLIDVLVTRLSHSSNLSDLTTHRNELWGWYLEELLSDWKLLLFGQGYTNVKLNGRGSHNSIIQLVWQFGIVGTPILIGWVACFFQDIPRRINTQRINNMMFLILAIGTFLPWMAIDILFFDEFFLMQMYVRIGIQQLCVEEGISNNVYLSQYSNVSG